MDAVTTRVNLMLQLLTIFCKTQNGPAFYAPSEIIDPFPLLQHLFYIYKHRHHLPTLSVFFLTIACDFKQNQIVYLGAQIHLKPFPLL